MHFTIHLSDRIHVFSNFVYFLKLTVQHYPKFHNVLNSSLPNSSNFNVYFALAWATWETFRDVVQNDLLNSSALYYKHVSVSIVCAWSIVCDWSIVCVCMCLEYINKYCIILSIFFHVFSFIFISTRWWEEKTWCFQCSKAR